MNWAQGVVYGLISGLTEFLPISSHAHQRILLYLFGVEGTDPVLNLVVHFSALLALYYGIRNYLMQLRREKALKHRNKKNNTPLRVYRTLSDLRIVKTATLPMLICMLLIRYIFNTELKIPYTAMVLAINGFILFLPFRLMQGNKGPNQMSKFDCFLMGIAYSFICLPGISGIGAVISVALTSGADRKRALNWALLMSIPAFLMLCGIDLFSILTNSGSIRLLSNFFCYLLAGAGSFAAGYGSIVLLKRIFLHNDFAFFSFYCWGAALLLFLLYLTVA